MPKALSTLGCMLIAGLLAATALVPTAVGAVGVTPAPRAVDAPPEPPPSPVLDESVPPPPYVVATSATSVPVHENPEEDSSRRILDPDDESSGQLVFLVREQTAGWLEVYLPVRPNGSTGWIRRDDVEISEHQYRIQLSISERRLVVFDGERVVMDAPIGVGTANTPTPGGVYYLKELLQPSRPDGFYGPYAYGLSGFSNVLDEYNGGDGVIGVHGTDEPTSIGREVSSGCIRLPNTAMLLLVEEIGLPLGTPVVIQP